MCDVYKFGCMGYDTAKIRFHKTAKMTMVDDFKFAIILIKKAPSEVLLNWHNNLSSVCLKKNRYTAP